MVMSRLGPPAISTKSRSLVKRFFCRCYVTYLYNLRSIPEDMLTQKGRKFLESMKAA
ncbi:Uncharacterised protein [Raoultella planticola]|uniref:Uncharacterized protein n=1 Tax=Raoultella planticola TaxID=575 RepID=A0A485A6E0_RAOPL|nr:Uncharacterised protein [Raoultella planticola]